MCRDRVDGKSLYFLLNFALNLLIKTTLTNKYIKNERICPNYICQRTGKKCDQDQRKNNLLVRLGKECIRILEERRQDKFMAGTSAVVLLSERENTEAPRKKPHVSYRLKRQARCLLHLHTFYHKARLIRAARHLHNISLDRIKLMG